ncbi:MAG: hypothetical protein DLM65_12855 [Candidatus Aeolococcus gillhamiae]|uniref:Uncharacterized protein n=1 Tax=Candidatus Aeolococcus gillhamiae TaxID=3127015 RepID=A0A2W5Z6R6_9BACT|nr:MAG: hypothetical protein DLM65_12855 [Candidatus Dormibacter sp. RRmetagenome_bin12]
MTEDDRDLSAAFDELKAPPSTASYATRTSGLDGRARTSHWPQALAGALVVAVALAGAGTFLALRTARHGDAPSSSAGGPPARSNAAMAYDSAAGVTVMFGGTDASGKALTDAWTWDGSSWKAAARGPGPLVDVRMVDDPADAGVLLLGVPAAPVSSSGGSVSSSGCVGSGTATPGSVSGGTPNAATVTAAPAIAPAPSNATPPTGVPVSGPALSCPPVPLPVVPAAQTWLFSDGAWSGASGNADTTPPAGAQLAFDTATHQVVAVSAGFSRCGPRMLSPVANGGAIACPLAASSSKPAIAPDPLCLPTCAGSNVIVTWTWSRGFWMKRPASVQAGPFTFLFSDPGSQHATLMTQSDNGLYSPSCPATASCPRAPSQFVITSTWTGSDWQQKSQLDNVAAPPTFAGGTVAAVEGQIVVLTNSGETWHWRQGHWVNETATTPFVAHPNQRTGAAMSEGPGATVVLFGGEVLYGFHGASSPATVGADTWVWDAKLWRHAGGGPLPAPPSAVPCPAQKNGVIPPCVQPEPAVVSPGSAPAAPPAIP